MKVHHSTRERGPDAMADDVNGCENHGEDTLQQQGKSWAKMTDKLRGRVQ